MSNSDNTITPDENGRFGDFGGRYVAETLMPPILELEAAYEDAKSDPDFISELDGFLNHYVGRPSPLYYAERLTEFTKGAKIYFKRDELNHTGAHKINIQLCLCHASKRALGQFRGNPIQPKYYEHQ